MKGLILAGGKGTRLRPLTINTPKPIVPVANSPFLLYQVDLMRGGGIEEVILSLSYQPRKIEDLLKDGSDYGVRIRYAVEANPLEGRISDKSPWGQALLGSKAGQTVNIQTPAAVLKARVVSVS